MWINWMHLPVSLKIAPVGDFGFRESPQGRRLGPSIAPSSSECGVCEGRQWQPSEPLVLSLASAERKSRFEHLGL